MLKYFCAIPFAFALTTPATAQEDLCNKILPFDMAVGEYVLTIGPGTFSAQGMTLPYTKVHNLPATIWRLDDELHLESSRQLNMTFDPLEFNSPDWDFSEGGALAFKTDLDDLALGAGCNTQAELPRLFANGVGSYFTEDGTNVPTKMGLAVFNVTENGVWAVGGMRAAATTSGVTVVFNLQVQLDPK